MTDQVLCSRCGKLPAERGYELPLCGRCRNAASRCAIPAWVGILFAVLILPVIYGFGHLPAGIRAGTAYNHGRTAEDTGNFPSAVTEYTAVCKEYPGSSLATARLGIAQYKAGAYQNAAATLTPLNGRKMMPWVAKEVMGVVPDLQTKLNAEGATR